VIVLLYCSLVYVSISLEFLSLYVFLFAPCAKLWAQNWQ